MTMNTRQLSIGIVLLAIGLCATSAQGQGNPTELGRDDGTVTIPIEIQWGEGGWVVVPFDHPLVPDGTPTQNCPDDGQANPALGLPAGFPNGGGILVDEGTGIGRRLGKLTLNSTRCALQFFPLTDPPFANFDLRATLTAANGDQIFIRNEFVTTSTTPPEFSTPNAQIVGGTGRFEGATGWTTPTEGIDIFCDDPLCLTGTWSGGFIIGEITIPRP